MRTNAWPKNLNTYILIGSVAVGIIVIGLVLLISSQGSVKTSYTAEDFPDASTVVSDPDVIQQRVDRLNELYRLLGTNVGADDFIHWMNIGMNKRNLADYRGAEEAWLTALNYARNSAVYGNLAALYFYEFKESDKAIEYYNEAIRINPHNFSYYSDLAGVYRYLLGNQSDKVEEVMLSAVAKDSVQANNYYLYLIDYYNEIGNTSKFNEYLDKVLDNNPADTILESLRSGGYIT